MKLVLASLLFAVASSAAVAAPAGHTASHRIQKAAVSAPAHHKVKAKAKKAKAQAKAQKKDQVVAPVDASGQKQ